MSVRRILSRAAVAAVVVAAAGIAATAWTVHTTGRAHARRRAARDRWQVWDDEDDDIPPSAIEAEMLGRNEIFEGHAEATQT